MKNYILIVSLLLSFVTFSQSKSEKLSESSAQIIQKSSNSNKIASVIKSDKNTLELRKKHAKFLKKSPFKNTLRLSKEERMNLGITPNKYYETEWELTMNPETGKPNPENVYFLRKQLENQRNVSGPLYRTPGDGVDNSWIERGPTNVGGRTRAVIFDPNDPTNETVFAGGVSGGLWKNTNISNANSVWTRVGIPENLAVSCITIDPNNSNIFYVGTGESYVSGDVNGDGVWKSTDGGLTWANVLGGISGTTYFESASNMTVNSPSGIVGNYLMVEAPQAFGTFPAISTPIIGDIAFQNDIPVNPAATVCDPFPNPTELLGKIALIRRGNCTFVSKVKAAQDAGAIAVIIMNNNTDLPFGMGGTDALITIPSVMISKTDGDMLQNALLSGPVNVSLNPSNGSFTGNLVPGIQHINRIKVRNNGGVSEVYVAAGDSFYGSAGTTTFLGGTTYGLYKSIDGGANWNEVSLPLTANGKKHCPNDIEIGADNKIWLSTTNSVIWSNGGGVIFSSTDGITFIQKHVIPNGARTEIEVSGSTPDKVYVLAQVNGATAAQDTLALLTTNDGFGSNTVLGLPVDSALSALDFTNGQAFYDLMLKVDPNNDQNLFAGGINIFKSTNGGTSWLQKSNWTGATLQDVHSDQHIAAFATNASNRMVFGNDGGVYFSNDSGNTISARNNGFNVTQFYSIGVAPTTNGMVGDNFVAGAQDNGSQMFLNAAAGQNSAVEVQGGDGAFCMFDQEGSQYRITNYVYNNTIRLYDYTTNTTRNINTETVIPGNGAFISIMALDSKLDILYADYTATTNNRIRRYKNIKGPGAFQKALLTNAFLNSAATALTVSPYISATSSSTLLIGTRNGRLLKLENADAGTSTLPTTSIWTNITGPGFAGSISDVEYGNSENEIFVTFHNYNVVSIWYTSDGGINWQNKEGDFPDIPVKAILRNPLNVDEVIIGTELGVWYTNTFNTASPIWKQSYNGMSNVKVTDLDLRNDNVIFAATYGRGVFSGAFTAAPLSVLNFEQNKISVLPNPSNGLYTVKMDQYSGNVAIQIIDLSGKEIYKNSINFNNEASVDISKFQSGIYVMKITGKDLNYSQKLIKN